MAKVLLPWQGGPSLALLAASQVQLPVFEGLPGVRQPPVQSDRVAAIDGLYHVAIESYKLPHPLPRTTCPSQVVIGRGIAGSTLDKPATSVAASRRAMRGAAHAENSCLRSLSRRTRSWNRRGTLLLAETRRRLPSWKLARSLGCNL